MYPKTLFVKICRGAKLRRLVERMFTPIPCSQHRHRATQDASHRPQDTRRIPDKVYIYIILDTFLSRQSYVVLYTFPCSIQYYVWWFLKSIYFPTVERLTKSHPNISRLTLAATDIINQLVHNIIVNHHSISEDRPRHPFRVTVSASLFFFLLFFSYLIIHYHDIYIFSFGVFGWCVVAVGSWFYVWYYVVMCLPLVSLRPRSACYTLQ